jgi:hypothetical protein
LRDPFRSTFNYPQTIERLLGFFALTALAFGMTHTFTTLDNFRIPTLFSIMSSPYGSPVLPVTTWPIYAAAISLACYQATWVYLSCRWPWHKPPISHLAAWGTVSGIIFVAMLANAFDFVDPYDRGRVHRYLTFLTPMMPFIITPFVLIPLLVRRRADVALIIQALFFAIALFPCLTRLITFSRYLSQNQKTLPGYAELSLDLFLAYTILTAIPFLITCCGISHLINKNRFLLPDPNPDRAHCLKCSYNLTGSQTRPSCPECGTPVPSHANT